MQSHLQN